MTSIRIALGSRDSLQRFMQRQDKDRRGWGGEAAWVVETGREMAGWDSTALVETRAIVSRNDSVVDGGYRGRITVGRDLTTAGLESRRTDREA